MKPVHLAHSIQMRSVAQRLSNAFFRRALKSNARCIGPLLAALLAVSATRAGAAPAPDDDVVFRALGDELKRSMSLQLEDLDKPYFVQYAVDDTLNYSIAATYGAMVNSVQSRSRVLQSQVRVGSYELDNSNFAGRGGGPRGLSGRVELPTDDDYLALRNAIWLATDSQYKDAVEGLTQKRAYMKDRNLSDRPPDFAKAGALTAIQEPAKIVFDRPVWEGYVRRLSARFAQFRHIQNSAVTLGAGAENRYLLNSEGSRLRYGDTGVLLQITADAQAKDGERMSDHLSYYAARPDQLPAAEVVERDVQTLAERLGQAIEAPALEDYTGPVLIDGIAAPQFFRQLLARGVAGQADPVGSPRRGPPGAESLDNRVGKRILPATFQIYDDPRVAQFQGTILAGHYQFDDEGVPAQRVDLVVDGKMQSMVMSRAPTKQFAQSNGHGRRAGGETPRSALGCLFIESAKGESPAELKKELIDAADSEGLKFGIRITSLQNRAGGGPGGFGGRFGRGGGGGPATRLVGDPISIYKVHVADGREEPVRGCEFNAVDVRSLRRIIAAGNVPVVHNSAGGPGPSSSVIAPSVLFEELELTKIKQEAPKKPFLEAPQARTGGKR